MKACEKGWLVGWMASQKQGSFSHSSGSRNLHTHTRSSSCTRFFLKELQENLHNLNFLWKSESEDISMTTPGKTAYSISLPFVFP